MTYLRILIVLLIGVSCANNKLGQVGNDKAVSVLIDDRDGQEYEVMLMKDGNYWMSENLNYEMEASWCFSDSVGNCTKYGRLYSWPSAMRSCPEGWKLPTDEEWKIMANEYKYATKDSIGLVAPASQKRPYWTTEERRNIFENLASIGFITGKGGVREAYGAYINQELMEHFWDFHRQRGILIV